MELGVSYFGNRIPRHFRLDAGREGEIEIAAKAAVDRGIDNLAAWGFDACAHMTPLRPGRPGVAWDTLCRTFAGLARR